jgi:hypothetical protein
MELSRNPEIGALLLGKQQLPDTFMSWLAWPLLCSRCI